MAGLFSAPKAPKQDNTPFLLQMQQSQQQAKQLEAQRAEQQAQFQKEQERMKQETEQERLRQLEESKKTAGGYFGSPSLTRGTYLNDSEQRGQYL